MRTNLKLLFYLKKPKTYQSGPMPVYLRFTVEGTRSEATTGRSCEPALWNTKIGRAKGTKDNVKSLNSYLDTLYARAIEYHRIMTVHDEIITAESLRNRFLGKLDKGRTIISVFEDHNQKMRSLVGQEFEKSTLQRYVTCLMHLKEFIELQYHLPDLPITKISFSFLNDFEYYLRSVRKCGNNSAIKYIKNLGKIVRICIGNGLLTVDPYINYKPKTYKVHRVALNNDELKSIVEKVMSVERLQLVKDIFVFSCYTGLAYVDVRKLKRSEIQIGIDGERWIYTKRQKTDALSRIPILPVALEIMNRYADHPNCLSNNCLLPVMSNQKMNAYLKEIADLCGITMSLTFHIARHTFATTVTLNNGVPIESVAKMMGHSNIKTTQIYAKVLDHKISQDMSLLRKKLSAE